MESSPPQAKQLQEEAAVEPIGAKVKLRLHFNGAFKRDAGEAWRYVGGEVYNESVPVVHKYADVSKKFNDKFGDTVSFKYLAPGEELDPESLIQVMDDDDLKELYDEYFGALQRPGTPLKTFRVKVFVFRAMQYEYVANAEDEDMLEEPFDADMLAADMSIGTSFCGPNGEDFNSWASDVECEGDIEEDATDSLYASAMPSCDTDMLTTTGYIAPMYAKPPPHALLERQAISNISKGISLHDPTEQYLPGKGTLAAAAYGGAVAAAAYAGAAPAAVSKPLNPAAAGWTGAVACDRALALHRAYHGAAAADPRLATAAAGAAAVAGYGTVAGDADGEEESEAGHENLCCQEDNYSPHQDHFDSKCDAAVGVEYGAYDERQGNGFGGDLWKLFDPYSETPVKGGLLARERSVSSSDGGGRVALPAAAGYGVGNGNGAPAAGATATAAAAMAARVGMGAAHLRDTDGGVAAALGGRLASDGLSKLGFVSGTIDGLEGELDEEVECDADVRLEARYAKGTHAGLLNDANGTAAATAAGQQVRSKAGATVAFGVVDTCGLPSRISAFGDSVGTSVDGDNDEERCRPTSIKLPSHISAFGEGSDSVDLAAIVGGAPGRLAQPPPALGALPFLHRLAQMAGRDGGDSPPLEPSQRLFAAAKRPAAAAAAVVAGGGINGGPGLHVEVPQAAGASLVMSKCITQEFATQHGSLLTGGFGGAGVGGKTAAADVAPLNFSQDVLNGGLFASMGAGGCSGPSDLSPTGSALVGVVKKRRSEVVTMSRIGEGAFGEVSQAQVFPYGMVAIKWLKRDRFAKYSESFQREAEMLARLNHPNIIRMYGLVMDGEAGRPEENLIAGIITEFVRNGSLSQYLRHQVQTTGRLTLRRRAQIAIQASFGMAYLHGQVPAVVHFDLKPDNLLVDGEGESMVIKVADFGLSKHKFSSHVSCRDLRGTLPYMAPELVSNPNQVSEKCDVWSMGVVMWELFTLESPFAELSAQCILQGLMQGSLHLRIPLTCEPEWRSLIENCMDPNPANRPSFQELAMQLQEILRQENTAAAPRHSGSNDQVSGY